MAVDIGQGVRQGAAGSLYEGIPVVIVATQSDGMTKSFCGNYALRRSNVPPFDQLGWAIFSADGADYDLRVRVLT